jgi:hypothetical protein
MWEHPYFVIASTHLMLTVEFDVPIRTTYADACWLL